MTLYESNNLKNTTAINLVDSRQHKCFAGPDAVYGA